MTHAILAFALRASCAVRARSCGRSRAALPRAGERPHKDVRAGLRSRDSAAENPRLCLGLMQRFLRCTLRAGSAVRARSRRAQ